MSNRGGRNTDLIWHPLHPVWQELEFEAWMAANPLPWPKTTNHRILISTVSSGTPPQEQAMDEMPYRRFPYDSAGNSEP